MALNYVTVYGTFTHSSGTVQFSSLADMTDGTGAVIVPQGLTVGKIVGGVLYAADGVSPLQIAASDSGVAVIPYIVTEVFTGGQQYLTEITAGMEDGSGNVPYSALVQASLNAPAQPAFLSDVIAGDDATFNAMQAYGAATFLPIPGKWTSYTPALSGTGWALGTGATAVGQYEQSGKTVRGWAKITFGSGSTYGSGAPMISLPVTAQAGGTFDTFPAHLIVSGTFYELLVRRPNANVMQAYVVGTNGQAAALTASSTPAAASGNILTVNYQYQSA